MTVGAGPSAAGDRVGIQPDRLHDDTRERRRFVQGQHNPDDAGVVVQREIGPHRLARVYDNVGPDGHEVGLVEHE